MDVWEGVSVIQTEASEVSRFLQGKSPKMPVAK